MSSEEIRKNGLRVYVRMHDGSRLLGSFYLSENERLQDVMNDDRGFLPLHAQNDAGKYQMIMLSKRYIQQVEEVAPAKEATQETRTQIPAEPVTEERRSGVDRRKTRLVLELDDNTEIPQRRKSDRSS